ncbi:MAG: pyruvate carboxylase subunit B [Desulfobacteraceae bacterium]|jgi:pyruvate/oxaloacetate carboxyltransferase/biotin carboxyl carrier protein
MNHIEICDSTLTDGFQLLFSAMGRTPDLVLMARLLDEAGYSSVEISGNASFDVPHRHLNEDPWERIRLLARALRKTSVSMVLRGRGLVGYYPCPDDVVNAFIERVAANKINIVKLYDPLNDTENLAEMSGKIKTEGMALQGGIHYSLTSSGGLLNETVYNFDYYIEKAKKFEGMGADSLCIKDSMGIMSPFDCFELVSRLKDKISVPVFIHTRCSGGMGQMTLLKACEAGAKGVDTCISVFGGRNSLPAAEPLVKALSSQFGQVKPDLLKLDETADFVEEEIIPKYRLFLNEERVSLIDSKIPAGQIPRKITDFLNMRLKEVSSSKRLFEAIEKIPAIRKDLGQIPFVSPASYVIALQALNNTVHDESEGEYKVIAEQIAELVKGKFGKTPREISSELRNKIEELYPEKNDNFETKVLNLTEAAKNIKGLAADIEDELIYAIFPKTGKKFLKWKYHREEPPRDSKPLSLEEARERLEKVRKIREGRTLDEEIGEIPKKGPRTRVFNVFVGDEFFEVAVDPGSQPFISYSMSPETEHVPEREKNPVISNEKPVKEIEIKDVSRKKAVSSKEDSDFVFVKAPMPGSIESLRKKEGEHVREGEVILVLEAMKMENPLTSPAEGVITEIRCKGGDQVPKDFILCVIDKSSV